MTKRTAVKKRAHAPGSAGSMIVAGRAFKAARKALIITQEKIAERLGIDQTLVSHFEAGRRFIEDEQAADGLGLPVEVWLEFKEDPSKLSLLEGRAAATKVSLTRFIDHDDPYPNRVEALTMLGSSVPSDVAKAVRGIKNAQGDLEVQEWIKLIVDRARMAEAGKRALASITSGALDEVPEVDS